MQPYFNLAEIREYLKVIANPKKRVLFMPGDGRYQPEALLLYFGYDMWAAWLVIVEWAWLVVLAKMGEMPKHDARLLTKERLFRLLKRISTTRQDATEKDKKLDLNHDILALLHLMRLYLPKQMHRWLHCGATSYDIICTAYALQLNQAFCYAFWPKIIDVDTLWREQIQKNAITIQAFRTHLQTALPGTVGFWLAQLHNRFAGNAKLAYKNCSRVEGKFSGAVGTHAAQTALFGHKRGEKMLMQILEIKTAKLSTQIAPPESMANAYYSLVLLSGAMANLGEDVRILQSTQFGELISFSSSSSAMPHKTANPISAENLAGMHITVVSEFMKILLTLTSNLQRDLRWSSVMRSYAAVAVYCYQQLLTTEKLLKSLKVNKERCFQNYEAYAKLLVSELLHLSLQREGCPDTHHLVNKKIAPWAAESRNDLAKEMDLYLRGDGTSKVFVSWGNVPKRIKSILRHPERYLGKAVSLTKYESGNKVAA